MPAPDIKTLTTKKIERGDAQSHTLSYLFELGLSTPVSLAIRGLFG
jgi:hypothetical protein